MNKLLLAVVLLFVLQSDGCNDTKTAVGTVGSAQDSAVTREKRAADKGRNLFQEDVAPTPTPVEMREIHDASSPAAEYIEEKGGK